MIQLLQKLREPFPDRSNPGQSLLSLIGVGVFVSLFLFLIRPFDIGNMADNTLLFWICLGFGAVTVLFGWIYDLSNRYLLRIQTDVPTWTLGKWIINSSGLILWIAFGNCLFMSIMYDWNWVGGWFMVQMIGNTLFVGIFPITFSGLMIQMRAIKVNQQQAGEMQPQVQQHGAQVIVEVQKPVTLSPEVDVAADNFRYAEAMQNYVTIWSTDSEGKLQKEVLRSTIARLEEQLSDTSVFRCHRSFLVNVDCIGQVSGNAQGLKLKLPDVPDFEVPVSRTYIPQLRALLRR